MGQENWINKIVVYHIVRILLPTLRYYIYQHVCPLYRQVFLICCIIS